MNIVHLSIYLPSSILHKMRNIYKYIKDISVEGGKLILKFTWQNKYFEQPKQSKTKNNSGELHLFVSKFKIMQQYSKDVRLLYEQMQKLMEKIDLENKPIYLEPTDF